jgi:DUF1365 family protein
VPPLRSRLYECQVMHRRFAPKEHGFRYGIFLFAFDLDELEILHQRLRLFSFGRTNLYSFWDGDYLPTNERPHNPRAAVLPPGDPGSGIQNLKSRVIALLARHGVDFTGGRIELVTLPRVAGYLFNPVSFYFCYDRAGTPVAAVPEVTNTFREIKPFFLGPECRHQAPSTGSQNSGEARATAAHPDHLTTEHRPQTSCLFRLRVPKQFYVSPFSDVDVAFDFMLRPPGERLSLQIDDYANGMRTLTSTLMGRSRPLTDAALIALTLRHPLVPLRTLSLIHWHALRLWLKRVPWFSKAARAADQRDLWRPHSSLMPRPLSPDLGLVDNIVPSDNVSASVPLPHRTNTV